MLESCGSFLGLRASGAAGRLGVEGGVEEFRPVHGRFYYLGCKVELCSPEARLNDEDAWG